MRRNLGLREENEGERETCSGPEARQPPASQSSSEVRYTWKEREAAPSQDAGEEKQVQT